MKNVSLLNLTLDVIRILQENYNLQVLNNMATSSPVFPRLCARNTKVGMDRAVLSPWCWWHRNCIASHYDSPITDTSLHLVPMAGGRSSQDQNNGDSFFGQSWTLCRAAVMSDQSREWGNNRENATRWKPVQPQISPGYTQHRLAMLLEGLYPRLDTLPVLSRMIIWARFYWSLLEK
jgi:hypothetical protein